MAPRQKRLVYLSLAAAAVVLFVAGLVSGWLGRHNAICKDGRPPLQQQDTGIGQVEYLCHDGQIVTK